MLWSADKLIRPTFRNLTDSFEAWAYQNGFLRELKWLEKRQLIEHDQKCSDARVYRLTEQGRIHALGGRDPEASWSRSWDGLWRIVLYDIPTAENRRRDKLRRYMRDHGFGLLQKSAWITPDPLSEECGCLSGLEATVGTLVFLEGRPGAGETDSKIVESAWDFETINCRYQAHQRALSQYPGRAVRCEREAQGLLRWAAEERAAWQAAMTLDPLLPQKLLPKNYAGRRLWRERGEILRKAASALRDFNGLAA